MRGIMVQACCLVIRAAAVHVALLSVLALVACRGAPLRSAATADAAAADPGMERAASAWRPRELSCLVAAPAADGPRMSRALVRLPCHVIEPRPEPTSGSACSGSASPWAAEADIGLYSIYAWRGFLVTDDPVIQGSVTVDFKDLSLNVWGNVDTTDFNGTEWNLNEVNLTLDYTRDFRLGCVPCAASIGSIAYLFPITSTPTLLEFYVGLSADVLLQPTLTLFREVLDQDYLYASFDLGHRFDFCWSDLDLGAGVGWGDNAWHRVLHGVGGEALHEFHARAAWNIPRGRLTFSPTIWWSSLFRNEVRSASRRADLFVAALVVSYSF